MERYKLMHFYVDDNWELYDLKTDPEEMHNLYGKKGMEKITTELKAELARLQKNTMCRRSYAAEKLPEDILNINNLIIKIKDNEKTDY